MDFIISLLEKFGTPVILALITLFAGKVLVSGDLKFTSKSKQLEEERLLRRQEDERCKTFEVAYRIALIWCERVNHLAGATVMAHRKGDTQVALGMLNATCDFLVQEDGQRYSVKEVPDFYEEAREELAAARAKEDAKA